MTRADAAKKWGCNGENVDRCNRRGREKGVPPPWHDAGQFVLWYLEHYNSTGRLPSWVERVANAAAPAPAAPSVADAGMPPPFPSAASDPVVFFRSLLSDLETRITAAKKDPVAATGIFTLSKNYGELLTKLHDAEDRARSAGQTRELPADRVAQIIDGLHARIPRRLTADLRAARAAAARAAVDPDPAIWAQWCQEFFDLATRRLVETRFADVEQRRAG